MAENSTIAQRLFHDNVLPACATSAVLVAGNLVDAAVTGQCLGKAAVAAFGIANPILLGVIGLSGMLGVILINRIILSISTTESVAVFSLLMSSANLILIDGTAVGSTVLTV